MSGPTDIDEARKARAFAEALEKAKGSQSTGDPEIDAVLQVARRIRATAGGELRPEEVVRVRNGVFYRSRRAMRWIAVSAAVVVPLLLSLTYVTKSLRPKGASEPARVASNSPHDEAVEADAAHEALATILPGTPSGRASAALALEMNAYRVDLTDSEGRP